MRRSGMHRKGSGAEVVHVPPGPDGYIPLDSLAPLIDERTQLVAVTQVCFRNGARLDIAGIARLAHERGARVMVDCYQSVGAMTVDVRDLDVDFAVGGMLSICSARPASGSCTCARVSFPNSFRAIQAGSRSKT